MTYAQCRRRALELIFSYSLNGTEIPSTYNDQADYINRIPALVNEAQMETATVYKPIAEMIAVSSLQHPVGAPANVFSLPNDCWKINDGGFLNFAEGMERRVKGYTYLPNHRIYIPFDRADLFLEYYRYPVELPDTPSDYAPLDNTVDAQECVPYYAAAHLVLYDDAYRYTALLNEYRRRCALLTSQKHLKDGLIENVYV